MKPLATEAVDKMVTIAAENFMVGLWDGTLWI